MKKFFSLVLALVMALSLTTVAWAANDAGVTVDGTLYETENSLLTALTNNSAENKTFLLNAGEHAACVVSYTYVKDGTVIDGTDAATTSIAGLKIASSEGIDNLTIQNVKFTGDLHISGGATTNITIKDCVFANGTQLYIGAQGYTYNHTNVKVIDCDFLGTTANGTSRLTIQCPANATVTGNTFASSGYHAVQLGGTCSGTITVTDNTITGAVKDGFRFADFASGAVLELQNNIIADTANIGRGAVNANAALPTTVKAWNNEWNGAALLVEDVASTALADATSGGATSATLYVWDNAGAEWDVDFIATGKTLDKLAQDSSDDCLPCFLVDGEYFVETTQASATYKLVYGAKTVYLAPIAEKFVKYDAKASVLNVVDAEDAECGDWYIANLDEDDVYYATYDKKTGAVTGVYVAEKNGSVQLLVNGKIVDTEAVEFQGVAPNVNADVIWMLHDWKGHDVVNYVYTTVKCTECGKVAKLYANATAATIGKVEPMKVGTLGWITAADFFGFGAVAPSAPSTDKVTSAETFDAGIALYVGMSVMAAAGSAVVIGKKKD